MTARRPVRVRARATIETAPGVSHPPGAVVSLPAAEAEALIARGLADPDPVAPKPSRIRDNG